MSAERLREAAAKMRDEAAMVRRPYGRDERVALAVADWLDKQAEMSASGNSIPAMRGRGYEHALAVANAYLGDQP